MPAHPLLEVEQADDAIVVTLTGKRLTEENARLLGGLLLRLAEAMVRPSLLLDCRNVGYMTAAGLGTLVTVHRGVSSLGKQLTLSNVPSHLYAVFEVTHLNRVLDIRRAS